jgi:predicted site-specific integrase-resolvase
MAGLRGLLTRKDISRHYGVSRALLRRHIEHGRLKPDGLVAGAEVFFDSQVDKWFISYGPDIRRRQKLAVQ